MKLNIVISTIKNSTVCLIVINPFKQQLGHVIAMKTAKQRWPAAEWSDMTIEFTVLPIAGTFPQQSAAMLF